MGSIVHAVDHIEWVRETMDLNVERTNKIVIHNNSLYLQTQQENENLKCEIESLEYDIQSLEKLFDKKP